MKTLQDFKKELLKDPETRAAYDALEPEFALASKIIEQRIKKGLTQKELAKKVRTQQSAIARLESGSSNPSMAFLVKIAKAFDTKLVISFNTKK